MASELLNADFEQRVVIATDQLPWVASPQAGVERRMLDRIGGEVARATSLVRYAADSSFPSHAHALGEEFLVLEGTFSDEQGDYPAGTYVRNPPGSRHAPRTAGGCTILVKLRQMNPLEQRRVVVDTTTAHWEPGELTGHRRLSLYSAVPEIPAAPSLEASCDNETVANAMSARAAASQAVAVHNREQVMMEQFEDGVSPPTTHCPAGEEIFVLSGTLSDEHGSYPQGTWLRNPAGFVRRLKAHGAVLFWAKRGHLPPP